MLYRRIISMAQSMAHTALRTIAKPRARCCNRSCLSSCSSEVSQQLQLAQGGRQLTPWLTMHPQKHRHSQTLVQC